MNSSLLSGIWGTVEGGVGIQRAAISKEQLVSFVGLWSIAKEEQDAGLE
jgi:hypothetical protein